MKKDLVFHEKAIKVEYTKKMEKLAHKLKSPLVIEIQIYFSCMLGKRLSYYCDSPIAGAYQLDNLQFRKLLEDSQKLFSNVYIRFNVVMTIDCPVSDCVGPPPLTDFNIVNREVYVPHWLYLDAKNDEFVGEYGWKSSRKGLRDTRQIRSTILQKADYLPKK
jgi:hypothetical protein